VKTEYNLRGCTFNDNNCRDYANRLLVLIALDDVTLPSAFGSSDTKIRSLLLNVEQMEAINKVDVTNKLMILGWLLGN